MPSPEGRDNNSHTNKVSVCPPKNEVQESQAGRGKDGRLPAACPFSEAGPCLPVLPAWAAVPIELTTGQAGKGGHG